MKIEEKKEFWTLIAPAGRLSATRKWEKEMHRRPTALAVVLSQSTAWLSGSRSHFGSEKGSRIGSVESDRRIVRSYEFEKLSDQNVKMTITCLSYTNNTK